MIFYFAYGSNMDWEQMRARCPSASYLGVAMLKNYKLAFTRRSASRKCGVADVIPEEGRAVWGVIYQIDNPYDVGQLDCSEGYLERRASNSYLRQPCVVYLEGDENRPREVQTFYGVRQENPPLPNAAYKRLIVEGAKYWGLPKEYIEQLDKIEVAG